MRDFATKGRPDAVRASGKIVVESEGEAPIDWSRPVLEQRSQWRKSTMYSKALITKVPLSYSIGPHAGSHTARRVAPPSKAVAEIDEGLQSVRMRSADKEMCERRESTRCVYFNTLTTVASACLRT